MNNVIAIGGLKNAGKDTVATMLQYLLGTPTWMHNYNLFKLLKYVVFSNWEIVSFAEALKETLGTLINVPYENFEDRDFKENYYIYFPTLEITNTPPKTKIISDKKFNRQLQAGNYFVITEHYLSIRQLLQAFGTEVIRTFFGDNFWILRTFQNQGDLIISDLRFKTEHAAVKERFGVTLYIDRGGEPGQHKSENEVIELLKSNSFDFVIKNNGTLKDLFDSVALIVPEIEKNLYGRFNSN